MNNRIREIEKIVEHYVKKCNSRNPFDIAKYLNIKLQIGELGTPCGCYMFLKNHRCIFLNENLSENEMNLVMSHELGHAIMHRKLNCYFIRNKTLLLNSKIETEANLFAAELLIADNIIADNLSLTTSQLSRLLGYEEEIIKLRLSAFKATSSL